jgi:hypothetical protein
MLFKICFRNSSTFNSDKETGSALREGNVASALFQSLWYALCALSPRDLWPPRQKDLLRSDGHREYPTSSRSCAKNSLIREQTPLSLISALAPTWEPVLDPSCHSSLACEDIFRLFITSEKLRIVEQSETPNSLIADA